MDWIAIFKAGEHTDSNGNTKTWSEADLNKIASAYNPSQHEAPVVIGHPKDNAPAWGWVEALKSEGGVLYARLKGLIPEFVDMVSKGMFKKRSVSLYPDMTLRHIGFLGAVPPAVKGLPDIAFKEGGIAIEFEDTKTRKEEKGMKFFEWLKGLAAKEGVTLEDVPQSFSEADVQIKINAALKAQEAEYSEKVASLDEARKKKEAELKAKEDILKAKEETMAKAAVEEKKKAIASYCEGLLKAGKLTPAIMKLDMGMQSFLEQVSGIETAIEFGEDNNKKSQTPLDFMQAFLFNLPKQIEFGEAAGNEKDAGNGSAGERLAEFTKKKMEQNKDLTYNQAFAEVQKENNALAAEYAEELKGGN